MPAKPQYAPSVALDLKIPDPAKVLAAAEEALRMAKDPGSDHQSLHMKMSVADELARLCGGRHGGYREAAQKALFKQNDTEAIHRALNARTRTQPGTPLRAGDWCFVWRNNLKYKKRGWVGPGVVITATESGASLWINMRGRLLKCSREQVRRATEEEWLGDFVACIMCEST